MTFIEKKNDLTDKAQKKLGYIATPANCGKIVRGNFDGIIASVYIFMAIFLLAAMAGIYLYVHHR